MINVLILGLHGIIGGSETYINNLIRCFDKKKINCEFLVVGNDKTPFEDSINAFYNDEKNHFYYCPDLKLDFKKGNKWLKKFYNEHSYDLIYLNATSAANAIYCKYALDKKKIPLITHSHFSNGPRVNHLLFRPYTCKKSVAKLACSELAAEWMFGKKIDNVEYIANGIDTERFSYKESVRNEMRTELGISKDKIILGHVGRFSIEKNHKFFIELATKLPEKYMFLCIGEGPCKEEFCQMINEKGLQERFIILPVKTDVEKYYCAMDMFVMPSLYEGLPIVSVEAQCSGLPVVFSDTISRQADLSSHCYFEVLNGVNQWKDRILQIDICRYDGKQKVEEAGFSNWKTAEKIGCIFDTIVKNKE